MASGAQCDTRLLILTIAGVALIYLTMVTWRASGGIDRLRCGNDAAFADSYKRVEMRNYSDDNVLAGSAYSATPALDFSNKSLHL